MFRLARLSFLAASWLTLASQASAVESGWLVYELKMTPDAQASLNFQFYNGAYVVAPVHGGVASLVLTSEDGGRHYAVAQEAARIFTAANASMLKTVLSALALNGSAQACYMAAGEVNQTVTLPGAQGLRSFRAAKTLHGTLIATDDDSETATLPADGSVGMVGSAVIEGSLREDLTYNASKFATQKDALLYLVGLLERYGYTTEGGMAGDTAAPEGADASLFPAGSEEAAQAGSATR